MERVYPFIHLFCIFLVFGSLGGLMLHVMNGGDKESNSNRKLLMITHGIAMVLILIAGVGMIHRNPGWNFSQGWVHAKLGIWLILGIAPMLISRMPNLAKVLYFVLPLLGALAYYVVNHLQG